MHGALAAAEITAEELVVGMAVVLRAGAAAARAVVAAEPRCLLSHISGDLLVLLS